MRIQLSTLRSVTSSALLGLAMLRTASATEFHVPSDGSLSSVVTNSAASNDTIIVDESVTLTGQITIDPAKQNLLFASPNPSSPSTVTAREGSRIFSITQGSNYTFDHLIFQGSGSVSSGMAMTITGTGAATTTLGGTFTVNGFTATSGQGAINSSAGVGGLLILGSSGGTVTLTNNTTSGGGAAVRGVNVTFAGEAVVQNNMTTANNAGGIYVTGDLTFQGAATLTGNTATAASTNVNGTYGGAIHANTAGSTMSFLGDAVLSGNSTTHGNGGAIRANGSVIFDKNLTLSNNTANRNDAINAALSANGGGLFAAQGLTINGAVTATGNSAVSNGGAIYVGGNTKIGSGSSFTDNTAGGNGGALYLNSASTLLLDAGTGDILFQGNTANGTRNALYLSQGGTLDLAVGAGRTLSFFDPIASTSSAVAAVNKTGAGTVLFDGGTEDTPYNSNIHADTTVTAGTLQLARGAVYGANDTTGSFTLKSGTELAGNGTVLANDLTLEGGSTLRATEGGTLTLTGTNRSFDSATGLKLAGNGAIDAGAALSAASISVDGATTLTLQDEMTLLSGGTITTSGSGGTLAADSAITLAGATTATAAANQDFTIAAALDGAGGSVVKTGAGSVTLSGANTYGGGTTISSGTLIATTTGALGSGAVTNNASLAIDLSADGTLANAVGGAGDVTKTGAATLTLSGANTYTGATTINHGTLQVGSAGAASGLASSSGIVLANTAGATFDLGGHDVTVKSLSGGGSSGGLVALGASTLTVNRSAGSDTYAAALSGSSGSALTKTGAGTLVLSGTQPLSAGFAGDVTVAAGALNVTGGTLATSGQFTVQAGASLGLNAGTALIDAAQVTFANSAIVNITGYSATTLGAVDLVASSAAISADLTQVSLQFDGAAVLPSVDQYLALQLATADSGTKLQLLTDLAWRADASAHGTFNISSGATFATPVALSDNTTFTSSLGGWDGRTLTKKGDGTLALSQVSTYTGATQVEVGTLRLDVADAIASSSAVVVSAGAALDLNNHNQAVHQLSGAGAIQLGSATLTADQSADATLSGVISGAGGALVKQGAGTLTLSGANTYTGGTTISAGKLVATDASALGAGGVVNDSVLEFNVAGNGAYAGAITGGGDLAKSGAGTVVLTAATGSAGTLAVNAGTLALGDDTHALAFTTGSATVASGAALTADKNSTLTVAGALDLADNSTLNLVLGSTAPIITAQSATIGATGSELNLSGITGSTAMPFTLVSTTGGITGDFATVNVGGSGGGSTDYLVVSAFKDGNNYVVNSALAWNSTSGANGVFTLTDAAESFDLGTVLADRDANAATGWDGKSLTKAGAGMLTLSAANTYTGATRVDAGVLRFGIADAIASSSAVTVAGGATLDLNNQNQSLNNLSGAGAISLGSATLTAANTTDATLSGVVSGSGTFVKQGAGVLTLSGVNTFSGGTTISAGKLVAANVDALGTGGVTNNAALEFAAGATGTYAGAISGTGTITKLGTGALTFTGNSSGFSGGTSVQAGTLAVNGTLGGTLTIASGARLQGTGTVGTTTISGGGTLAPGNSIGTLNVSGNLTFASNSIYEVEIEPTGASDRTNVSGTASIQSGATVSVTKAAGTYDYGTRYTILTAAGGVTGSFTELTQNLPLLDLLFSQDANNVYLDVRRNTAAFDDYAETPNQRATARAVEAFGVGNTLYMAVTGLPDAETVRTAFDHLSGELHASVQGALIEDARIVRDIALERGRAFAQPPAPKRKASGPVGWAQITRSEVRTDGGSDLATTRRSTTALLAGVDFVLGDQTRAGLLVGQTDGELDAEDLRSSADLTGTHFGAYANRQYDRFSFRGGAGYSRHVITTARTAAVASFRERLTVDRDASVVQAFGEVGYLLPFTNGGLEPFANASFVRLRTDAFDEIGGDAALHGRSETRESPTSTLGARVVYEMGDSARKMRFVGSAGWQHAYESTTMRQHLAFSDGEEFRVFGLPLSRDMFAVEAGVGISLTPSSRFDLGYSGRLSSDNKDHNIRGVVTLAF